MIEQFTKGAEARAGAGAAARIGHYFRCLSKNASVRSVANFASASL
jgi:hypothetical protein